MQARYRLLGGYALLALLLDQLTKLWVLAAIPEHKSVTVIPYGGYVLPQNEAVFKRLNGEFSI